MRFCLLVLLYACPSMMVTAVPDAGEEVDAGPLDSGSVVPAPIAAADFCAALAAAQCARLLACGRLLASEVDTCVAQQLPACLTGVTRGPSIYDAGVGGACVASIPAVSCDSAAFALTSACNGLPNSQFPTSDAGQTCDTAYTPAFCFQTDALYCAQFDQRTCGVCTPRPTVAPGGTCSLSADDCPLGSYCNVQRDGGIPRCDVPVADGEITWSGSAGCASRTLHPLPDGGLMCGSLHTGEACIVNSFGCPAEHFCTGVCTPRIDAGLPCANLTRDDGCAGRFTCLDGVCTAIASGVRDAGTECEYDQMCRPGHWCDLDGGAAVRQGVCVGKHAGSSCVVSAQCVASETCFMGTCKPLGGPGDSCEATQQNPCRPIYECVGGQCVPVPEAGELCRTRCVAPDGGAVFCWRPDGGTEGSCREPLGLGERCISSFDARTLCASGRCVALDGTGPQCVPGCFP